MQEGINRDAFYSRQLYALGHDAHNRISSKKVLLVGIAGVGMEIGALFKYLW